MQQTPVDPDLRQYRIKLLVRIFMKIFGLSGFFNPDLRQYRMKSALSTSRNADFCPLERFGSFQAQHNHAQNHQRAYGIMITTDATACNIRLIV